MVEIGVPRQARGSAFAAAWARLVALPRRQPGRRGRRFPMMLGRRRQPDPVALAVLAIDRVGPAAVRACACGSEVRIAAPDEATAAIMRAALAVTARRRGTDRLVRIVVE